MGTRNRVVLKVGGSILFSNVPLEQSLAPLLHDLQHCQVYMIVGGGELVESMRLIHDLHPSLDSRRMHWRCVDLLNTTQEIAAELTPSISTLDTWESIADSLAQTETGVHWVKIQAFYNRNLQLAPPFRLEESWNTTSDSLAWLLAHRTDSQEVQLLKSCAVAEFRTLEELALSGVVDPELPRLARLTPKMNIRLRNLVSSD